MERGFEFVDSGKCAIPETAKLPTCGSERSAGYDFYSPVDAAIEPGQIVKIPTYVKAKIPAGEVLLLFIRSSLGIKYGLMLANCVGVIDADYYGNQDNDGNIIGAIYNAGGNIFHLKAGERFMQGVFVPFLRAENIKAEGKRSGGIGSTGK